MILWYEKIVCWYSFMMIIRDVFQMWRRRTDIRLGLRPKRVRILFYNIIYSRARWLWWRPFRATHSMKVLSRIHCQLCSGVIKDSLIIFIHLLMTNPPPLLQRHRTALLYTYYYNIRIYASIISFYFSRPPPRLPIMITGRLLAVIIKIKIMKTV